MRHMRGVWCMRHMRGVWGMRMRGVWCMRRHRAHHSANHTLTASKQQVKHRLHIDYKHGWSRSATDRQTHAYYMDGTDRHTPITWMVRQSYILGDTRLLHGWYVKATSWESTLTKHLLIWNMIASFPSSVFGGASSASAGGGAPFCPSTCSCSSTIWLLIEWMIAF